MNLSSKTECHRTATAILSASELSLGSYLHALHIPFTGQLMSLNQCFWLNIAKKWAPHYSSTKISLQVSATKLMSPMGKRITPMIAITMQGLLFEVGNKLGGRILGSILSSLWSVLQPLLVYTIFLGNTLWSMLDFFSDKIGFSLGACFLLLVVGKILVATIVCLAADNISDAVIYRYGSWIHSVEQFITPKTSLKTRSKNILRSPLSICLTLVSIYLYFTSDTLEIFFRHMLFYVCWTFAAYYIMDLIGERLLRYAINSTESPKDISQGLE